jgi:hypothetical protein
MILMPVGRGHECVSALMLIVAALAIGVGGCTASAAESAAKQFALCEMDAIKATGWQEGDWYSQAGRYLYACMRGAGYDLTSEKGPTEEPQGHCRWGDMQRIVLPECYEPYPKSAAKQFGLCEMDAIKNLDYHQGDYDGPAGRYLYACMRAAGYGLKSQKRGEGYCTVGDKRIILLPECYEPVSD